MPAERFFLPDPFSAYQTVSLKGDEFHHLAHVMRLKCQEIVELINGKGELAHARIEKIEKQQAILTILSIEAKLPSDKRLILALAYPRMPRLEYAIEKCVELGATEFWLFPGELSEKKEMSPTQIQRIHHIIVAAVKQCGRLFAPKLCLKPSIFSWESTPIGYASFFGDTNPNAPFFSTTLLNTSSRILFAIGPEKGFHNKETTQLEKKLHMQGVKLHENILRTDTACLSAVCQANVHLSLL